MTEESGENIEKNANQEIDHNENKLKRWSEFMGGRQKKQNIIYAGKRGSDK